MCYVTTAHGTAQQDSALDSDQSDLVADGEAQRTKVGLDGVAWKSSFALAQLAGSNVREEASASLWERLPLCCTDAFLASSAGSWRMRLPRKK